VSSSATPNRKELISKSHLGEAFAFALLLILALRTMQGWLCRISMPVTWDYGPAQLWIHVDLSIQGAPLYCDFRVAPFVPLIYGPVVPVLTRLLAPMFGREPMAALEAGRTLTIASTMVVCAMIVLLARRSGASVAAALFAMLGFILSPIVLRWGFEYRVDMPALACEFVGIFAFAGGASATAIVLFVLSCFIQQAHAVGIAAVVLFSWTSGQRRRAITMALLWLLVFAAGTALLARIYPYYLLNSFGAVRMTSLDLTAPLLFSSIMIGGSVGLTIFAVLALTRHRMTDRLMICLLIVASIHDVASCLRWGSNAYYFLPTLAALTIVSSKEIDLVLERMRSMRAIAQIAGGVGFALLLSLGFVLTPRPIALSLREAFSPSTHCPIAISDPWDSRSIDLLHSIKGPVLTDMAELKLIDGQANLQWIDLMALTAMEQLRSFDDAPLLDSISRREVAAFALDDEGLNRSFRGREFFWPRLRSAIETNYEPVRGIGPPYLMLPKRLSNETPSAIGRKSQLKH